MCERAVVGGSWHPEQAVTGPLHMLPANPKNVCPSSRLSQMTSKPAVGTLPAGLRESGAAVLYKVRRHDAVGTGALAQVPV